MHALKPSIELPGKVGSVWTAAAPKTAYPSLADSMAAEVVVVGGGIVGLTSAYLLTRAGLSVVLVEARRIGRQVTGGSTAKITTQHSLIYHYLIERFGFETAQRYAEANRVGMDQIGSWVENLSIDCDYEIKDAFVYCTNESRIRDLEVEGVASRTVGLDADLLDRAPLPFSTAGALRSRTQAQFNPAKYLVGLAAAAESAGTLVFEKTRVTSVEKGDVWELTTNQASIQAQKVVLATNLPIAGPIPYDERTRPRSHIAMAFRPNASAGIDGMFIGVDEPTHSLRMGRDENGPLLVVLGSKFATGLDGDVAKHFRDLQTWAEENLDAGNVAWRWVNEDYDTLDRMPFIGELPEAPGLCVATGLMLGA